MKFVISQPSWQLPAGLWVWQFYDSQGNAGTTVGGYDTADDARTGCEDFITAMGGDPSTATIEEA